MLYLCVRISKVLESLRMYPGSQESSSLENVIGAIITCAGLLKCNCQYTNNEHKTSYGEMYCAELTMQYILSFRPILF